MTLIQANALIKKCDRLFRSAARAWVAGNNSGSADYMRKMDAKCNKLRDEAESQLAPLGIEVDYPGLYPSFKVKGFDYFTTESAVSAALE